MLCRRSYIKKPAEEQEGGRQGSYWPICFPQLLSSCFQRSRTKAQFLKVGIYSFYSGHENEFRREHTNKLVTIT